MKLLNLIFISKLIDQSSIFTSFKCTDIKKIRMKIFNGYSGRSESLTPIQQPYRAHTTDYRISNIDKTNKPSPVEVA